MHFRLCKSQEAHGQFQPMTAQCILSLDFFLCQSSKYIRYPVLPALSIFFLHFQEAYDQFEPTTVQHIGRFDLESILFQMKVPLITNQ